MLIVCPSCATSYMLDPAAMGAAGRTVRCARCKTTWFAGAPARETNAAPELNAFVDGVIAEAQAQSGDAPPPRDGQMPAAQAYAAGDFSAEPDDFTAAADEAAPPLDHDMGMHDSAPAPMPGADDDATPLTEAPPLVPPNDHDSFAEAAPAAGDSDDIESFAVRRERLRAKRESKRRSSRWTAIILVLIAFNVALVGARSEVVRYLPQTASLFAAIGLPVNLRHLKFEDVKISRENEGGINILIVEGSIVSTSGSAVEVPRLRFAARNASGQEIYTWTMLPARSILEPGEKLPFRSRLAAPPPDAVDVLVRFFSHQDAIAGGK
jgi:predicted Zn finger-like uncharacterized protein